MKKLAVALFIISSCAVAFGQQRPLLTEDIDTTPAGRIEVSIGTDFIQNAKMPLSGLKGDLTRVGDIRIRTGYASNVEVTVEGTLQNYLAINSRAYPSPIPLNISGNSTNDFDDFIISAKFRMRNESKRFPGIAMKFGYQMPNTDQARGIGTNQINIFSKLILQKSFGAEKGRQPLAKVYGNVGLGIMNSPLANFSQNDVFLYGLAGIFRVSDRINVASEINGRMNTRTSGVPLGTESIGQFRIGAQVKAANLRFDSAAILGLTKYSPRSGVTFGVTYLSPKILPEVK